MDLSTPRVPDLESPLDLDRLRRALLVANLPSLIMVIYQFTGDIKWLKPPYLPSRTRGLSGNDSGGFSEEIQREIRTAAERAILQWSEGEPVAIPAPRNAQLLEMMSTCVGEHVPEEFELMMAEEMGYAAPKPLPSYMPNEIGENDAFSVIVIGAGVSGLLMARKLQELDIPVVIFEKNEVLGGTWLENIYPGCGVDTPSHLYSYSFSRREWSSYFGKRDEVLEYLNDVAESTKLSDLIRFSTEVIDARYDESRQRWSVTTSTLGVEQKFEANFLVTAVGQLNRPNLPDFPGADEFEGIYFHSSDWPAELDLAEKRVAVVGSAATAMQIVPAIVDRVAQLSLFQRSPQWIAPSDDYFRLVDSDIQWLMSNVPFYYEWYRFRLAWIFGDRMHASLQIDPEWPHQERSINGLNDAHRRVFTEYLRLELEGRDDLIKKSLPTYPPFGKRMLLDNGWFAAIKKPNLELIDEPMVAFTQNGVRSSSGLERKADVVVFATGFEARRFLAPMNIVGRDGQTIRGTWGDDDGRAYLGMTAPGFPNMAIMYGPNTNLGHGGSYIFIAECQTRYIVQLISEMIAKNFGSIECRVDVNDAYNEKVDEAHSRMIYNHTGMSTWYRNSKGRVVTNSPWRMVDYWQMTHEPDMSSFVTEPRLSSDSVTSQPDDVSK